MEDFPSSPRLPTGDLGPKSPTVEGFFKDTFALLRGGSKNWKREKGDIADLNNETDRIKRDVDVHPENEIDSFDGQELAEGESRELLDLSALQTDHPVHALLRNIKRWVNDILALSASRIQIQTISDDLADGMVLQVLFGFFTGEHLTLPTGDFVQSKERQKRNLTAVLAKIDEKATQHGLNITWNVNKVFEKNILATMSIILALIHMFGSQIETVHLPNIRGQLMIDIQRISKKDGRIESETISRNLLSVFKPKVDNPIKEPSWELLKYQIPLLKFGNTHLGRLNRSILDLNIGFQNGVNLILLIGQLEGFFVPLHVYNSQPTNSDEIFHNLRVAFDFLKDLPLQIEHRPDEVAQGDVQAIIGILSSLWLRHNPGQSLSNLTL